MSTLKDKGITVKEITEALKDASKSTPCVDYKDGISDESTVYVDFKSNINTHKVLNKLSDKKREHIRLRVPFENSVNFNVNEYGLRSEIIGKDIIKKTLDEDVPVHLDFIPNYTFTEKFFEIESPVLTNIKGCNITKIFSSLVDVYETNNNTYKLKYAQPARDIDPSDVQESINKRIGKILLDIELDCPRCNGKISEKINDNHERIWNCNNCYIECESSFEFPHHNYGIDGLSSRKKIKEYLKRQAREDIFQ
jgi:hypothetical protein